MVRAVETANCCGGVASCHTHTQRGVGWAGCGEAGRCDECAREWKGKERMWTWKEMEEERMGEERKGSSREGLIILTFFFSGTEG